MSLKTAAQQKSPRAEHQSSHLLTVRYLTFSRQRSSQAFAKAQLLARHLLHKALRYLSERKRVGRVMKKTATATKLGLSLGSKV